MHASLQRVRILEWQLQQDAEYLAEQNMLRWQAENKKLLIEFISLFPKTCRRAVMKQFRGNSALQQLFYCMESRRWPQVPIPLEVAQVYLADSLAAPYQRCIQCHLLLPLRWGIWTNLNTKSRWQAPLRYFASCPACDGVLGSREEGKPYIFPYVPVRIEPPWVFQDEADLISPQLNDRQA